VARVIRGTFAKGIDNGPGRSAGAGVLIGRVPNAVSPRGGHGDLTLRHRSPHAASATLAATDNFDSVLAPVAWAGQRCTRAMVWQVVSACYGIVLASEIGTLRGHVVTVILTFAARKDVELSRIPRSDYARNCRDDRCIRMAGGTSGLA